MGALMVMVLVVVCCGVVCVVLCVRRAPAESVDSVHELLCG